jgi:two-component system CheB/CheR fusion protein
VEKAVTALDGRWFTVRIMPYRTLDDRIDGVVITFTNISESKTLEAKLRDKQLALERRITELSPKLVRRKRSGTP